MWKNIKNAWRWIWIGNRYILKLVGLLFLIAIIFTMISYNDKAEAAGDTIEDKKEAEVVFAVCVFADGSLIDHKGADSMSDCLKTKREVEKAKTGGFDLMFNLTGLVGLAAFSFIIYAIVYLEIPESNKEVWIHLIGISEGIVLSIFGYFYGSAVRKNKD